MYFPALETERLILRPFTEADMEALFALLRDEEVNAFLPWFPPQTLAEARALYGERFAGRCSRDYAVCLKAGGNPMGYVTAQMDGSYDIGYALRREYWRRGIATEAVRAVLDQLKREGVPFVTATHDVKNPRSGGVMRRLGMQYQYTYEELWQPKNRLVTFRLYQLNLNGDRERVYRAYWENSKVHFVETFLEI